MQSMPISVVRAGATEPAGATGVLSAPSMLDGRWAPGGLPADAPRRGAARRRLLDAGATVALLAAAVLLALVLGLAGPTRSPVLVVQAPSAIAVGR